MAPNSSISNSSQRSRWALTWWCGGLTAAAWLLYAIARGQLCARLAAKYGEQLISLSKGRVLNPESFLQDRFWELAGLTTVAAALVLIGQAFWRFLEKRIPRAWLWAPLSLFLFAEINVWAAVASQTGSVWILLFAGYPNLTQSSFQSQRIVIAQAPAPIKVYVMGSSQGQSEIHTGELNELFEQRIAFGNLGVSGATAYDFLMLQDHVLARPPAVVVCYVSELNFYETVSGRLALSYLTWRGIKETLALGEGVDYVRSGISQGIMGSSLPLYRMRRAVETALFGGMAEFSPNVMIPIRRSVSKTEPVGETSSTPDSSSPATNADQISEAAPPPGARQFFLEQEALSREVLSRLYKIGGESKVNQLAFERFLERNVQQGIKTVLIQGQLNPDYAQYIDPAIRQDFEQYLREIERRFPEVQVLREELPQHTAQDYDDYWHINPSVRESYTQKLAQVLAEKLGWPKPKAAP